MKRMAALGFALVLGWAVSAAGGTVASRALEALQNKPPVCPDQFDFVVCGDSRSAEPIVLPKVFYDMIQEWNVLQPAFVVDLGDLILGGDKTQLGPMWDEFEKAVGGCAVPFVPVVGNHDVNEEPETNQLYEQRIGPLRFSFGYGNAHFICMNSEEVGFMDVFSPEQMAWLKEELSKTQAANIFLLLHKPIFETNFEAGWAPVAEAIKGRPVKVVFAGHEHLYRDCGAKESVRYVITGGGGAETSDVEQEGGFHHYLWVRVRGGDVQWSVIKPGAVLPSDVVTKDKLALRHSLQQIARSEMVLWPFGQAFDRQVAVQLKNPLDKSLASRVEWEIPAGWNVSPANQPFDLPAGGMATQYYRIWTEKPELVRFPAPTLRTVLAEVANGEDVEARQALDLVPAVEAVRAAGPVTIDGKLDEWAAAQSVPMTYAFGMDPANAEDLKASLRWMWDDTHLYIAVEVEDNEFHQPYSGDLIWTADSIELWLDEWIYSLSLTPPGPQVFLTKTPQIDVEKIIPEIPLAIFRKDRLTVYEAAFGAQDVAPLPLQAGAQFRSSVLANDLDPATPGSQRHWLELSPGAGEHFRCPKFNVTLK